MRTIVDLPDEHVRRLDLMAKRMGVSRAELIRRGVEKHLEDSCHEEEVTLQEFAGMFAGRTDLFDGLDGLGFEQKIRAEWNDRERELDRRLNRLNDHPQKDFRDE